MAENLFGYKDTRGESEVTYNVTPLSTAQVFSADATYIVGNYCFYQGALYRFVKEKSAGAWDASCAVSVRITDDFKNLLNDKLDARDTELSGSVVTFEAENDHAIKDLTVAIEPVQAGTGDPSPDNVRPISGWTGANVFLQAENLFDDSQISGATITESGLIANSSSYYVKTACVKKGLTYYTNSALVAYWTVKPDKNITGKVYDNTRHSLASVDNFVPPMDGWVALRFSNSATNPMLSLTPFTEYKAPTGTTLPISWETEAGTVYGGSLNVTTGLLTVKWYVTDPTNWEQYASSNGYKAYRMRNLPNGSGVSGSNETPSLSNMIS